MPRARSRPRATRATRWDLGEALFLVSAFFAPIEILLAASFTLYDLLTSVLFAFAVARGRVLLPSVGVLVPALLFLFFALLSTLGALHPIESLTQGLQYVFIFFVQLPVMLTYSTSRSRVRRALVLFVAGGLVTIAAAFFTPESGAQRARSMISESPNRLAYPTAYLTPFACHLLLEAWRTRWRVPAVGLAVGFGYLVLWALAGSGSRSGAAGFVVAATVFLAMRGGLAFRPAVLLRLAGTALAIGAAGYLLYRSPLLPVTLRSRIERTLVSQDTLVQDRTVLAVAGWRAFRDSPLLGLGLDNFRYVTDRFVPTASQQNPHNIWIQLLAQTGLFGTLAFLALFAGWFARLLRVYAAQGPGSGQELVAALVAAMGAILTIFLFIPAMTQRQYWWIYGLGLGVARVLGARRRAASPGEEHRTR